MTFVVVITRDRQPGSYRWTIRSGINQPNELPLSRSEKDRNHARRAVERLFGPLTWIDAAAAGAAYDYIVECAKVEIINATAT